MAGYVLINLLNHLDLLPLPFFFPLFFLFAFFFFGFFAAPDVPEVSSGFESTDRGVAPQLAKDPRMFSSRTNTCSTDVCIYAV